MPSTEQLAPATKRFIVDHRTALERCLSPTVQAFGEELARYQGAKANSLLRAFTKARSAWMKFFWATLGRHWIRDAKNLDAALIRTQKDLLSLDPLIQRDRILSCSPKSPMDDGDTIADETVVGVVPVEPILISSPEDTTVCVPSISAARPPCRDATGEWA